MSSNTDFIILGGKSGFDFMPVKALAEFIGAPEVGLRFILGLFAGFPLALIYPLLNFSPKGKHLYFAFTGLLINYFCFGSDCIYTLFSIITFYISHSLLAGTIHSVIMAFIFQTTYLMAGYILNASSDGYDVKWTTPQCILCMKLIGLAWDVYDGKQKEDVLNKDQLETRVVCSPSFLEVLGFTYCFGGFFAGPQFSFNRYIKFVNGTLISEKAKTLSPSRFLEGFKRFCTAVLVIIFFQLFDAEHRPEKFLKTSFQDEMFLSKVIQMGVVYYVQFSKYVFTWCLSESVCMLLGLSYDGISDDDNTVQWDALPNFRFQHFLFGTFFQDYVTSFNVQTNIWVGRYLFRRLRFLGNKTLSHLLTLLYLAVWHGFYIGYFFLFLWEYLTLIVERQVCGILRKKYGPYDDLPSMLKFVVKCIGSFLRFICCGFYVQSFLLLRWRKIKIVYASVYYWPVIMFALWFVVIQPLLSNTIKSSDEKKLVEKKEN